jgi:hypothetical protein
MHVAGEISVLLIPSSKCVFAGTDPSDHAESCCPKKSAGKSRPLAANHRIGLLFIGRPQDFHVA